eukprot:ANDGO_03564.mRNA.1 OTU domain-containing protein 2
MAKKKKASAPLPPPAAESAGESVKYMWEYSSDEESMAGSAAPAVATSDRNVNVNANVNAKAQVQTQEQGQGQGQEPGQERPLSTMKGDAAETGSRGARKKAKQDAKRAAERERVMREAANAPARSAIENGQIQKLVESREMKIFEVPPDGHCLYRAIALQLYSDPSQYPRVRWLAANHLREFPLRFMPFCEVSSAAQYERYCGEVEKSAEWGGHVELLAIAQALKSKIQVFSGDSILEIEDEIPMDDPYGPAADIDHDNTENSSIPLRVSFHRFAYSLGEHYNAVVPVDQVYGDVDFGEDGDDMVEVSA